MKQEYIQSCPDFLRQSQWDMNMICTYQTLSQFAYLIPNLRVEILKKQSGSQSLNI